MINFEEIKRDKRLSYARVGIIKTSRGEFETPLYVFAGTDAKIRALNKKNLNKIDSLIANTYHLGLRTNKVEIIEKTGGLNKFMDYQGLTFTDSGGFQVFSYGFSREHKIGKIAAFPEDIQEKNRESKEENLVKLTEKGVWFKNEITGEEKFLGPRESIMLQEKIGADIMMSFDECTSPLHSYQYTKQAMERTHKWEAETLKARRSKQALFGIIQGGYFRNLREESAKAIINMDFDGIAVGGSFGRSINGLDDVTSWIVPIIDEAPQKPRHLLGIGKPLDLFDGVMNGMDTFDCVIPTREARHGSVYTDKGRVDLTKGIRKEDEYPIEKDCLCEACLNYSRRELKEMIKSEDARQTPVAELLTMHNIVWFQGLMQKIREAIKTGRLSEYKQEFKSKYK